MGNNILIEPKVLEEHFFSTKLEINTNKCLQK